MGAKLKKENNQLVSATTQLKVIAPSPLRRLRLRSNKVKRLYLAKLLSRRPHHAHMRYIIFQIRLRDGYKLEALIKHLQITLCRYVDGHFAV